MNYRSDLYQRYDYFKNQLMQLEPKLLNLSEQTKNSTPIDNISYNYNISQDNQFRLFVDVNTGTPKYSISQNHSNWMQNKRNGTSTVTHWMDFWSLDDVIEHFNLSEFECQEMLGDLTDNIKVSNQMINVIRDYPLPNHQVPPTFAKLLQNPINIDISKQAMALYKQASLNNNNDIDFTQINVRNKKPQPILKSTDIHTPSKKSLTSPVNGTTVKEQSKPVRIPLYNTVSELTDNDALTHSYNNLIEQLERLGTKMPLLYQKTKDVCPIRSINYNYEIHDKRNYDNIPDFTKYYYEYPYKDGQKIDMNPYNVFSLNVKTSPENESSCRLTQIDTSNRHEIPNSNHIKDIWNQTLIDNFYTIDDIQEQFGLSDDECTEMFNDVAQRLELSNIICDKLINEPLPNKNDLNRIRSYMNYTSNADKNLLFSYGDPMKNPVIKQFLDIPSSQLGKYGLSEDFYNYDVNIDLSSYLKNTNLISLDMSDLSYINLEH